MDVRAPDQLYYDTLAIGNIDPAFDRSINTSIIDWKQEGSIQIVYACSIERTYSIKENNSAVAYRFSISFANPKIAGQFAVHLNSLFQSSHSNLKVKAKVENSKVDIPVAFEAILISLLANETPDIHAAAMGAIVTKREELDKGDDEHKGGAAVSERKTAGPINGDAVRKNTAGLAGIKEQDIHDFVYEYRQEFLGKELGVCFNNPQAARLFGDSQKPTRSGNKHIIYFPIGNEQEAIERLNRYGCHDAARKIEEHLESKKRRSRIQVIWHHASYKETLQLPQAALDASIHTMVAGGTKVAAKDTKGKLASHSTNADSNHSRVSSRRAQPERKLREPSRSAVPHDVRSLGLSDLESDNDLKDEAKVIHAEVFKIRNVPSWNSERPELNHSDPAKRPQLAQLGVIFISPTAARKFGAGISKEVEVFTGTPGQNIIYVAIGKETTAVQRLSELGYSKAAQRIKTFLQEKEAKKAEEKSQKEIKQQQAKQRRLADLKVAVESLENISCMFDAHRKVNNGVCTIKLDFKTPEAVALFLTLVPPGCICQPEKSESKIVNGNLPSGQTSLCVIKGKEKQFIRSLTKFFEQEDMRKYLESRVDEEMYLGCFFRCLKWSKNHKIAAGLFYLLKGHEQTARSSHYGAVMQGRLYDDVVSRQPRP